MLLKRAAIEKEESLDNFEKKKTFCIPKFPKVL